MCMSLTDKAERAFQLGAKELQMVHLIPTASVRFRLEKEIMDDLARCFRKYQFLRKVRQKYFWVSYVLFLAALFLSCFVVATSGQELKPLAYCTWTAFGLTLVFKAVMTKKLEPRWELHEELGDRLLKLYVHEAESQFSSFMVFHGDAVTDGIGLLVRSRVEMRIISTPITNYQAFRDYQRIIL